MSQVILMLDDEESFTELTKTLLNFHDLEVDVMNNPEDIDRIISGKQYALVITDLMMPGIDGFEVVRTLRSKENYQNTPVIVLSAKTLSDEERKLLLQNNAHFLTKPFDPHGLVDKVKELLQE